MKLRTRSLSNLVYSDVLCVRPLSGHFWRTTSSVLRATAGGGGCLLYISFHALYILIIVTYRVALAQENKRYMLTAFGCLICQT